MPYVRHSLLTIDAQQKDALVSKLAEILDTRKGRPGLRAGRVSISDQRPGLVKDGENRMCIMAVFEDKDSAEANTVNATSLREHLANFLIGDGSPLVREGEIIWSFDAAGVEGKAIMPGYMRHTAVDFDPTKYNAMMAYSNSTIDTFNSVSGLRRIRVGLVSNNRMIVSAAYDSKALAEAASGIIANVWEGFAEFLTGEPRLLAGDLVYAYTRGN